MTDILICDDEKEIADLAELYLNNENFTVHKAYNANDALCCVNSERLDLALLDVMLPDMDGFSLCKKIRESYNFPIIMLTAKAGELDKLEGLSIGADDYIAKPFSPLEMVARVKAQLRRYTRYNSGQKQEEDIFDFSGLILNKASHECSLNEKPLSLTPTEFSILWILCENKGQVVSTEKLFQLVWGEKYYSGGNNTVMVHIRHLREKMKDSAGDHRFIKTVWGVGYKIEK